MQPMDYVYLGVFSVMTFSAILWLTLYFSNKRTVESDPRPSLDLSVTFLVPAYNEEDTVAESIKSLLNQNYPEDKLNIIAINDGSSDSTLQEMRKFEDRIDIIDKENTGKANSINRALERVDSDLVGVLDADSFASENMVRNMAGYFENEKVDGVTPAIKVFQPRTWAQKVIWSEYIYQVFLRKIFSLFNVQYVLPGPGSLYRTSKLKELGGWDEESITEDMEIAFRIIRTGGLLENSTNAEVKTISPPSFRGLFKQRIRWYKGYMDNFVKYRDLVFNRAYGNVGTFFLPFTVLWVVLLLFLLSHMGFRIFQTLFSYVETIQLVGWQAPTLANTFLSLNLFHLFYALFIGVGIGTLLISLSVSGEQPRLRERKVHYLLFLSMYASLFAGFWVAAIAAKVTGWKKW